MTAGWFEGTKEEYDAALLAEYQAALMRAREAVHRDELAVARDA